jgi:hypothetical protein
MKQLLCSSVAALVPFLTRPLFAHHQVLVTEGGEVMPDYKEDGFTVMPLSRFGIASGSVITLRVVVSWLVLGGFEGRHGEEGQHRLSSNRHRP